MTEYLDQSSLLTELFESSPIPLAGLTIEEAGEELGLHANRDSLSFGFGVGLWEQVRREFYALFCKHEKRYADLERRFDRLSKEGSKALIAALAAEFSRHLDVASTAVLAPMVALLLVAVARVGKFAICAGQPLNVPIQDRTEEQGHESE